MYRKTTIAYTHLYGAKGRKSTPVVTDKRVAKNHCMNWVWRNPYSRIINNGDDDRVAFFPSYVCVCVSFLYFWILWYGYLRRQFLQWGTSFIREIRRITKRKDYATRLYIQWSYLASAHYTSLISFQLRGLLLSHVLDGCDGRKAQRQRQVMKHFDSTMLMGLAYTFRQKSK